MLDAQTEHNIYLMWAILRFSMYIQSFTLVEAKSNIHQDEHNEEVYVICILKYAFFLLMNDSMCTISMLDLIIHNIDHQEECQPDETNDYINQAFPSCFSSVSPKHLALTRQ